MGLGHGCTVADRLADLTCLDVDQAVATGGVCK